MQKHSINSGYYVLTDFLKAFSAHNKRICLKKLLPKGKKEENRKGREKMLDAFVFILFL